MTSCPKHGIGTHAKRAKRTAGHQRAELMHKRESDEAISCACVWRPVYMPGCRIGALRSGSGAVWAAASSIVCFGCTQYSKETEDFASTDTDTVAQYHIAQCRRRRGLVVWCQQRFPLGWVSDANPVAYQASAQVGTKKATASPRKERHRYGSGPRKTVQFGN